MKKLQIFVLAICAGISIGIGGVLYLGIANKVVGALLFTVGLYTVCTHGLYLYTGKIGYLPETKNKKEYGMTLLLTWLGNLVGTVLLAALLLQTRVEPLRKMAQKVSEVKLNDTPLSIFILSVFCGFLMYVGVEGYRQWKQPVLLFACVAGFILCGFEHCVANMFYFSMARAWSGHTFAYVLLMTAGNSLGSFFIPFGKMCVKTEQ